MILDGRKVRDEILEKVRKQIIDENLDLCLAIVYIGTYAPSAVYIKNKIKACDKVGIKTKLIHLEKASEEEIINIIEDLNADKNITGILLQSPLPDGLDIDKCIEHIDPKKDIDGFTKESFFKLAHNLPGLRPCTVKGIIRLLEYYNISLEGKNVCIIGRGNIVGKPLYLELLNYNATPVIVHTKTKDIKTITLGADIIIAAAGSAHLLTKDMVKKEAVVIDVGVSIIDGKTIGDADFDNLKDICSYISPNPGGVGPMTIAMIIENIIDAYKGGNI